MIRTAAALFSAALVFSGAASAQAPSPQQETPVTVITVGPNGQQTTSVVMIHIDSCPVGMRAKQRGLTQMIKTGQMPSEPQQYEAHAQAGATHPSDPDWARQG